MKQAKAVRNFLIGESVLILLAAIVLWRGEGRILDAGTLLILQAGIVLGTIFRIIRPLESFEKTLEAVTDGEWKEEEFGQVPAEVPYVEPIREAMERYAAFRTRENSAQIFNKQTELTAGQQEQLEAISKKLADTYPDLAKQLDEATISPKKKAQVCIG